MTKYYTIAVDAEGMRPEEKKWVDATAMKLYRMTASVMNAGVLEVFNADPRWEGKPIEEGSEYDIECGKLFMRIADAIAKHVALSDDGTRIIKLNDGLDCLLLWPDLGIGTVKCKVEDYNK